MTIDDSRDALIVFEILVSFFFFLSKEMEIHRIEIVPSNLSQQ